MDHDQRVKEMLREFFRELLALFLPWLGARLEGKGFFSKPGGEPIFTLEV